MDPAIKSPYTINMDFSIGREFSHGLFVQGSYVGRLSRHSLIRDDLAMPTNMIDPTSGQSYFQAAQIMSKLGRANTDPSKVQPIPFFENLFPGYAGNGQTATQSLPVSRFCLQAAHQIAFRLSAENCTPQGHVTWALGRSVS